MSNNTGRIMCLKHGVWKPFFFLYNQLTETGACGRIGLLAVLHVMEDLRRDIATALVLHLMQMADECVRETHINELSAILTNVKVKTQVLKLQNNFVDFYIELCTYM